MINLWRFGSVGNATDQRINEVNQRRARLVSGWVTVCKTGKPSWKVTSHPGQLSLASPLWVGAMSSSESWDVNRHTARCTSPVSVVWQCKPVSGWGLKKRRSAPPYRPYGSGRTLLFMINPRQPLYCFICKAQKIKYYRLFLFYNNVQWQYITELFLHLPINISNENMQCFCQNISPYKPYKSSTMAFGLLCYTHGKWCLFNFELFER